MKDSMNIKGVFIYLEMMAYCLDSPSLYNYEGLTSGTPIDPKNEEDTVQIQKCGVFTVVTSTAVPSHTLCRGAGK